MLVGGLKYEALASPNDHAQLVEINQAPTQAIAATFRVPIYKVGDLSKATYSNMEASELSYVASTLDPYYQFWEEAIRRDVLTTRQYGRFSVSFDRNPLIRSDAKTQTRPCEWAFRAATCPRTTRGAHLG